MKQERGKCFVRVECCRLALGRSVSVQSRRRRVTYITTTNEWVIVSDAR